MNCLAYPPDWVCITIFRLPSQHTTRVEQAEKGDMGNIYRHDALSQSSGTIISEWRLGLQGIIPTSYVLWAMYNSQVSLGLKRLVSFTVLSTLRPLPTPQMSDTLVNALTTIENALFLQNFEISGS